MKRIRTHVEGLDGVIGGGLPSGGVTLVTGPPGTMKSSLCYAILHANALQGRPGLYVSLEQGRDSLAAQMASLGMDREAVRENLTILDLSLLREKMEQRPDHAWMEFFKMYTKSIKSTFPYALLALDSLDSLEILGRWKNHRQEFYELVQWLRGLDTTALVIGELPRESTTDRFSKHREEYLTDGIIHLHLEKRGEFEVQRRLRVVKMRGARHETRIQALLFDDMLRVTPIVG